jgi:alanine racemase
MIAAFEPINQVEIDLHAVAHNTCEIRRLVGTSCFIVASLKSNAHGFGLIEVARTVLAAGADAIAVVGLGDAIRLRQAGVASPIMLYAGTVADDRTAAIVSDLELMPTVLDIESARVYSKWATRTVHCMVKVDVGLQRLGLEPEDVVAFIRSLLELPRLHLQGIYTHMDAIGDPVPDHYLDWQYRRFVAALTALNQVNIPVPIMLAASSGVLAASRSMNLNAIDPGRLFYGLLPPSLALKDAQFQPAFRSLTSRLVQVKPVVRSDFADRLRFTVRPGLRMGIFPMGRSDGIESLLFEYVLIRGRRAPILIRPSLEHTRVEVTNIPDAAVGDEVVIIGRQGHEEILPSQVTNRLKVDPGELAIGLCGSIERRYIPTKTIVSGQ